MRCYVCGSSPPPILWCEPFIFVRPRGHGHLLLLHNFSSRRGFQPACLHCFFLFLFLSFLSLYSKSSLDGSYTPLYHIIYHLLPTADMRSTDAADPPSEPSCQGRYESRLRFLASGKYTFVLAGGLLFFYVGALRVGRSACVLRDRVLTCIKAIPQPLEMAAGFSRRGPRAAWEVVLEAAS